MRTTILLHALDHRNLALTTYSFRHSNSKDWVGISEWSGHRQCFEFLIKKTGLVLTRSPHSLGWVGIDPADSRWRYTTPTLSPSDAPCCGAITGRHSIAPSFCHACKAVRTHRSCNSSRTPKRSHVPKYKGRRKTKRKVRSELTIKG